MAFFLRQLTASFVIALYDVVDTLLTTENQKLYLRHDWNRKKRNGEQLWQGLAGPRRRLRRKIRIFACPRGHGY